MEAIVLNAPECTVAYMISAIITLSPDANTLGALRNFVQEAARYSTPPETELIDGGHVGVADVSERVVGDHGNDLAAVIAFVEELADLPDETILRFATDLGIDLPVYSVEAIFCGEHIGELPENVVVTVNPKCSNAHD